jgi:type I restriction enzyme S subunit
MHIDVAAADLKTITTLLNAYLPGTTVWAFGSRVKFTSKPASDLDLVAFIQPEQESDLADLKEAFAESDLPFKVDNLDWESIPDNFKKNIEENYVVLQDKNDETKHLPTGWKVHNLSEIAEIIMGQSPLGETCNRGKNGIPLLNGPTEFGSSYPVAIQYTTDPKKKSTVDDILFCVRGSTTGKMNWSDSKYAIGRGLAAIRHKKGREYKYFLKGLIDFNLKNILGGATGSTFPNISGDQLRGFKVVIPDLVTQKSISSILSSLDTKIELNIQMNQALESIAQNIFKEWFVNFNFPGFDGELIDVVPKGWKMGNLGDEFSITMGQSPPGSSYSENNKGTIFFQGRTDFGWRFPTNRIYTNEPNRMANKLDTIVSVRAPVGDINMALVNCCIGRGLSAVRHKSNAYSYTYYSMKNIEDIFKGFESDGTVFGSINKTNFENINVIVPTPSTVREFEALANKIDEKILNNELEIRTLTELRNGLLPNLMTGKITVH